MERFDFDKPRNIKPGINLGPEDFPELGEGGIENPSLTDGDHILVTCANCETPLVEIWITSPEKVLNSSIVAMCGHCDEQSFVKRIRGAFHLGDTDYTSITNVETLSIETDSSGTVPTSQDIRIHTKELKKYEQ